LYGKVGIREFRNNMAKYVDESTPLAVIKHYHTVGYYIPIQQKPHEEDYCALQQAAGVFIQAWSRRTILE
jgi:hypothetical protein